MNNARRNRPIREGEPYDPQPMTSIYIILGFKVLFQQSIVRHFGAESLADILNSPSPFIFPMLDYERSWDVYIFILT